VEPGVTMQATEKEFWNPLKEMEVNPAPRRRQGHVKVREVSSGPAKWRRRQPGRRRKNKNTFVLPLMIGHSLGLDARFGGQTAGLMVGGVESRTRAG